MHQSFPRSRTSPLRRVVHDFMVGADGMAGVAMLEFAIFAPMLVIFIVFLLDFGFYTFRQMEVQHAAQAGAEYVITLGGFPPNCPGTSCPISTAVAEDSSDPHFAITATPAPSQFCGCPSSSGVTQLSTGACTSSNTCSAGPGTYVTVSAQGTYTPLVPPINGSVFFGSSSYTLSASATVRVPCGSSTILC